ncbi:MAG: M20/M25/M40 family metallo-hydrolase, partial [Lentisphaerae bacterium]|nr:M20/M25/M40 family metallo-hydrolase [Lentisphaerota bacterium]
GHVSPNGQAMTWDDCFVMTGLSEPQLRDAGVHEGAAMVPIRAGRGPVLLGDPGDPLLAAWTFDDRMGVVTLLRLLEEIKRQQIVPAWPLTVAFTIHEEGGCFGAMGLAHREKPAAFIAIDGCPVTAESALKLDGRPGMWVKDAKACYSHALILALSRAAEAAGVGLQRAVYNAASSDASAVYASGGAPLVAFIGHVRENSHGMEVARLSVFDNLLRILVEFAQTWPGPGVQPF